MDNKNTLKCKKYLIKVMILVIFGAFRNISERTHRLSSVYM